MRILFLGDIHGRFQMMVELINKINPDCVIQCGDFGYWPGDVDFSPLYKNEIPVYWCDGNHEDFMSLKDIKSTNFERETNCHYMERGSTLKLGNKNILFMGGAFSIDRSMRKLGISWFWEETIREANMYNLPKEKIDIIISHTCAKVFRKKLEENILNLGFEPVKDQSEEYLDELLSMYHPDLWIFGHFHYRKEGNFNNTKWICLPDIESLDKRTFEINI